MTADAESQQVANIEGTRHAVELAEAIEAGCFHMVSSIAAAGLYKGTFARGHVRGGRRTSTPTPTSAPSTSPRGSSARSARGPGASTGPGIVVGHSETGEMDKIDGPYYFFKLIQRLRNALPPWMPTIGVEGKEINLVPVDFVAEAMDHIAHQRRPRRQGLPPHRPEPEDAPAR